MPETLVKPISEKKIFFHSLGCPKNLVDTEVMSVGDGFKVVPDPADANVIVVNTCSFINDSKRESIDAILDAAEQKKSGKCERLIVTGCLPQRYKADLKVSFPEVDAFVGTGQYGQLLDFVAGKKEEDFGFKHPKYIHNEHTPRINSQPFYKAYLKISEGCIKACAFCIIPKIRGTLRSRTITSLVEEAKTLVTDEKDPEMLEMMKIEIAESEKKIPLLEEALKLALLPKDPNDEKNIILEIRA
jgi:ribosomal protein S12 methylthiotransferase